ncbi:MAG: hypothetical protein ACLFMX_03235 [Halobacteriales archaeon]
MNLDELRSVRDDARETGELQPLRPSFYAEARAFIDELRTERDRAAAACDDPFGDPEVGRLTDRLESATEVLESIYHNRVGKLLRHAATTAATGGTDAPPMTREERALYETLVEAIHATEGAVLEGEAAEAPAPPEFDDAEDEPEADADEPAVEADVERQTVRVTDAVGTILGVDEREYDLQPGDVVTLPVENARALIEREAARPVEPDQ